MKNRLIILAVILVAAGAVAWGVKRRQSADVVAVRMASVEKKTIKSTVRAQGNVRSRRQVSLGAEIAGRVTAVHVREGEAVEKDTPLFEIDDATFQQTLSSMKAAHRSSRSVQRRADLMRKDAERQLNRDKKLLEDGVIPQEALTISQNRFLLSQAELESARAAAERTSVELTRAEDAIRKTVTRASFAGVVISVDVEVGEIVGGIRAPSVSTDLLGGSSTPADSNEVVIADVTDLIADIMVDEMDVRQLSKGMSVEVFAQGDTDSAAQGILEDIGLLGQEKSGAVFFPARVKVVSQTDFLSGMTVDAEIEIAQRNDALAVPLECVLEAEARGEGDRVFVVDGDHAAERVVKLGPADGKNIAIEEGLSNGESVVSGPYRLLAKLKDGDKISELTADSEEENEGR